MNIEVKIRDRNGWKYALIPRLHGRQLQQSLHTRSEEEARELIRRGNLQETALAGKADALFREVWIKLTAGRKVLVRDAASEYSAYQHMIGRAESTIEDHEQLIDQWLRFCGFANDPVTVIQERHVSEFVNQPGKQKLGYRQKWLAVLKTFLQRLVNERLLVMNPANDVVVRIDGLTQDQLLTVPIPPFTEEEVRRVLEGTPRDTFWHGAVLLGYHFGLRLTTVLTLEESNVVANRLRVYTTKGRRVVNELMPDDLIDWLEVWRGIRPASDLPYLFPAQAAGGYDVAKDQFRRLLARLKIQNRSFHGLRKTAANRHWNEALQDLGSKEAQSLARLVAEHGYRKVQQLLGHAPGSNVTAEHYIARKP